MTDELEQKLRLLESAITLFRARLLSSQSLRSVLIELYNYLENDEAEKKWSEAQKKVKGGKKI